MLLVRDDFVPRYADAGYDTVIESVALQLLQDDALLSAINAAGSLPDVNESAFLTLYADLRRAGLLDTVLLFGATILPGTERYAAPVGLGTDGVGVWFGTPDVGTEVVRWYVNGALAIEREHDLSADRSATVAELSAVSDDIVQVCIVAGGVVGWWGRITIP